MVNNKLPFIFFEYKFIDDKPTTDVATYNYVKFVYYRLEKYNK